MQIISLIISIVLAEVAGVIGSIFTASSVQTWYVNLIKPIWTPPSWIFGPVWISLYALMGVASYLIWRNKKTSGAKVALTIYGVQLAMNALWSILFFGLKNPGLAFAEILILLAFILATTILFWKINKWAGILFLPYLVWTSFATFLNYAIWQLN
jgi:benzodiazapine receptor